MAVGGIAAFQIECASAAGETSAWRVLEAGGSVRHRPPGDGLWWQAARGDVIAPESEIVTDRGGSLVIGRAAEGIELGPHGRLMLPAVRGLNRVWQDGGRVLYRSSPGRRLEVETPYASLRASGTIFEATLEPGLLLVEVERGVVGVTTRDGAARTDLRAGQAARVRAGEVLTLEVRLAPDQAFQTVRPQAPATVGLPDGSRFVAHGGDGGGELYPSAAPARREMPGGSRGGDDRGGSGDPGPGGDGPPGNDGGASGPGFAGDPGGGADATDDDRRDAGRSDPGGSGGTQDGEGAQSDRGGKGDRDGRGGHGKGSGARGDGGKGSGGKGSGGKGRR